MIEIIGYCLLFIIIFLGVLYAIYINDSNENKKSFWQESKGLIMGQRRNSVAGLSKIDRQTVGFLIRIS